MSFSHSKFKKIQIVHSEKTSTNNKNEIICETGSFNSPKKSISYSKNDEVIQNNKKSIEGILESKNPNEEAWNSYISYVSNSSQSKNESLLKIEESNI